MAPSTPPPTLRAAAGDLRAQEVDVLVAPAFKGEIEGPGAGAVLTALGLDGVPVSHRFRGDVGQTLRLAAPDLPARSVLLVGLGRMIDADATALRDAAATAVRAVPDAGSLATTLAQVHPTATSAQAVGEGLLLGAHADQRWRRDPDPQAPALAEATILVPSSRRAEADQALERATLGARATITARELVSTPPADKAPAALAEAIVAACPDLEATVWGPAELAERGCHATLAVGGGSQHEPRMVRLRYAPRGSTGRVALVGKGVTFDSGGLSLKDRAGLQSMKCDMAGAAAVAGACTALADLGVRVTVDAWLPLVENLPGASAYRPGDVVSHPDGSTTEIVDTDAEGRLILADALALAAGTEPDAIVDLATLTGSAARAVGAYAGALLGDDEGLLGAVRQAGRDSGERLWPLPLWPELDRFLRSEVADHRQVGDGPDGDPGSDAILAALYLRRFVGEVPWVHADLPAAWLAPGMGWGHLPEGGTGFGVRTLLSWLGPDR